MRKRGTRPFRQGHLDNLCGLYSIVNAVQLAGLNGRNGRVKSSERLLSHLIERVEERDGLAGVFEEGLDTKGLWLLVKAAAQYCARELVVELEFSRPFTDPIPLTFAAVARQLRSTFRIGKVALICGYVSASSAHWSVVRGVSREHLLLFDSSGVHRMSLASCRLEGQRGAAIERHRVFEAKGLILVACRT